MKILMATDGSVHASTAMLTATRLLGEKPAEVDVVSVGPELAPCLAGGGARGHREYEKKVAGQTQKTLRAAQSILAQLHVKTHGLVEFGSPADWLLKLSPTYDLTVVGTYGVHERDSEGWRTN